MDDFGIRRREFAVETTDIKVVRMYRCCHFQHQRKCWTSKMHLVFIGICNQLVDNDCLLLLLCCSKSRLGLKLESTVLVSVKSLWPTFLRFSYCVL